MNNDYAVLVDNSVIIGASLSQEHYYESCRPFFDRLKKKPVGVVTENIKSSIKNRIKGRPELTSEDWRALDTNISLLRVEDVNYEETVDDLVKVQKFYVELQPLLKEYISESKKKADEEFKAHIENTPKIFRRCVKDCYERQIAREYPPFSSFVEYILLKKFFESPPSSDDILLLAEACYLKRKKYKDVSIVSTDHHLSSIRLENGIIEPFVPISIEEKLKVKCDWPDAILKRL